MTAHGEVEQRERNGSVLGDRQKESNGYSEAILAGGERMNFFGHMLISAYAHLDHWDQGGKRVSLDI